MKQHEYGHLNPVFKGRTKPKLDPDTISYLTASKLASLDSFSVNIMENVGAIKGVALYAWKETDQQRGPGSLELGVTETLCVKVRIPELHALPIPTALPVANDPTDAEADWETINLYPTFFAVDTSVTKLGLPQSGQVVYVDFENRDRMDGPLFLGSLDMSANVGGIISPSGFGQPSTPGFPVSPGVPVDLTPLQNFDPNGKTVEDMFRQRTSRGKTRTSIKGALSGPRLDKFRADLERHLQRKFPNKGYKIKGNGKTRLLEKAISPVSRGRVPGSLHGVGLAFDMNVINDVDFSKKNPPRGYTVVPDNAVVANTPGLAEAINEFVNTQSDMRWGGYFKFGAKREIQPQKLFEARLNKERFIYKGEIHHYEVVSSEYTKYWAPWFNVLAQVGISKVPETNKDRALFYAKVLQYFEEKKAKPQV